MVSRSVIAVVAVVIIIVAVGAYYMYARECGSNNLADQTGPSP